MIHQYKNNGYNIVMDVNSGSVHVVDDCVYDVIPRIEECINNGVKEKEVILTALKAERSGEGQQSGKEPVSYTHLRAARVGLTVGDNIQEAIRITDGEGHECICYFGKEGVSFEGSSGF